MKDTLTIINKMQADGIIGKYAIGGAIGASLYLEPTTSLDIDIFISFKNMVAASWLSSANIRLSKGRGGYGRRA